MSKLLSEYKMVEGFLESQKETLDWLKGLKNNDPTRFKGTVKEFFDSSKKILEDADSAQYAECPDCGGEGYTTCCGVGCTEPGWPDSDICAGCYEHTGDKYETCDGKGE